MWKIVQMETSNEKKLIGTYDLCRVNCKYFNNTCKYCGNTHEYWASTWKLCSTTASAIFASIITILVSVVELKMNRKRIIEKMQTEFQEMKIPNNLSNTFWLERHMVRNAKL